MTKVVPVKMSDDLYERLQDVAARIGEADSTVIRIVLRAGLKKIEADNYNLFSFEESATPPAEKMAEDSHTHFSGRGAPDAPVKGRHTASRHTADPSLNEDAPRELAPAIPAREKTPEPHVTHTRAALRKMQEREQHKGKP